MAGFYNPRLRASQRMRQFMSALDAGVSATFVAWDPATKSSQITLSGDNLIATATAAPSWANVRAALGRSSGKYYFEIAVTTGSADVMLGVSKNTIPSNNFCGQTADSYGYYASSGVKYNNNSSSAMGSTYTTGDVIGVAVDLTTGAIWFSKNGVWQSGDPSAGTGAAFTGLSGTYYPCASNHTADVVVGRFTAASMSYAPPTGFSTWG